MRGLKIRVGKMGGRKLRVAYFIFSRFSELMTESVIVPHTCLILDLIAGQAVHTKRSVYFMDPSGLAIQEVRILSRIIRAGNGNDRTQFTIVASPSPITSPAPPPELDVSVEVDQNPFCLLPYFVTEGLKMLLPLMCF
jgi:hypothetical protein